MTMEGTGIVPVMDMNNRNGYGDGYGCMGGGMWFMWIIVLFAFMWGGNGWGNRNNNGLDTAAIFANGSMTRDQVSDGFSMQEIKNGIRGVQNGLCDGFYAQNTTMLQGFNGIQRDLCQGFGTVGAAIAENRFAAQQCCCETNRNIDAVRYENAQNTCAITTNATANTQRILDKLCKMEMDAKDNEITNLRFSLQQANNQLSNQAQTANIVSQVRPTPVPAYITCSPYEAARYDRAFYGNGNCGCGCNGLV